jgi:ArsR family transcriptional regulator, arsenate/arsenite/antimonite-responsive transcriptional repressor
MSICQDLDCGGESMARKPVAVLDEAVCCPAVLRAPLSEADADDLARVFAALADPVRLRLLSLIADAGEVCSCDLLEPLGKSQPTISHHTRALADAGLIAGEKQGRWVWWTIVPERLEAVRSALAARR